MPNSMSGPVCWRPKRTGRTVWRAPPTRSSPNWTANALARLVFAKGGIKAAGEILGILGIDKRLRAQAASAGHDYAAEVVLFVLDPAARGHGLGRRMFETLMDAFRLAGVRDYFLFTDTTCDVGFYVHRGLTQVCEQSLPASVPGENPSSFYLYEGSVPEPA